MKSGGQILLEAADATFVKEDGSDIRLISGNNSMYGGKAGDILLSAGHALGKGRFLSQNLKFCYIQRDEGTSICRYMKKFHVKSWIITAVSSGLLSAKIFHIFSYIPQLFSHTLI